MSCGRGCSVTTSVADQRAARRLTSNDIATGGLHYVPPAPPTLSEMAAANTPVDNNQRKVDR